MTRCLILVALAAVGCAVTSADPPRPATAPEPSYRDAILEAMPAAEPVEAPFPPLGPGLVEAMPKLVAEVLLVDPVPAPYEPILPEGAVRFNSATWTQSIVIMNSRDSISQVPITALESKWHGSGGLVGLRGWKSEKFRYLPEGGYHWIADVPVLNGFNNYQLNRGIVRSYPDGTEFHDVLRNASTGLVFEHRVRSKDTGKWSSRVVHRDVAAYPAGYTGLQQTCASCHNEAGTGKYGVGLVPGGDTVLSDPLDWSVARSRLR